MKNNTLTAKEWLEKEGYNFTIETNTNVYATTFMERYANYKNRILEDRIKEFRQRLNKLSEGEEITRMFVEKGDFVVCEVLKEYDKHFNINKETI